MSDLSKLTETRSWIASWREHYGENEEGFKKHVSRVASEQRANFESCRSGGRTPGWCDVDEYGRCVELLEAVARGQ